MKEPAIYRIALCEDERIFSETQEQICRETVKKLNIKHRITVFDSGEEFMAAFRDKGQRYDLILLDIVMDGMNGMELAGKIREADRDAAIIFITSSREYALDGYEVGALHYLIKPVKAQTLERLITKVYRDKFEDHYFVLKTGAQSRQIPIKDIVSLETVGCKVEINLTGGKLSFSGKLTELLDELRGSGFVRCHQAYAVNIKNIRELNRCEAVTETGKLIPISRTYLKDVQTTFLMNMQES